MSTQDSPNPSASKFQKLLHRQQKDRLKSTTPDSTASSSSDSPPRPITRKSSKIFMLRNNKEESLSDPSSSSRLKPDYRPMSTVSDSVVASYGSSPRLSDLPSRLSGWISHTLTGSTTDLSLPTILSQSQFQSSPGSASPKTKASALLSAARHGKGQLDKVVRHILDSDSYPDKSTETIWLMGVCHPGYEPIPPPVTPPQPNRDSVDSRHSPSSRRSSGSSVNSYSTLNTSHSNASSKHAFSWPAAFHSDFTSRIWLTYRSQFAPIRDVNLSSLDNDPLGSELSSSQQGKRWNWPGTGSKVWTSDAGWGCMLRTGQSMLANALLHLHLGRDWRRPNHQSSSHNYIVYVKILTWFLDNPSPSCPFSVHRMALAGKELGKDVGQWFGPSTAAGAIKRLVHRFPAAHLAVSVASDGVVYDSDVYSASNFGRRKHSSSRWGGTAVLVLIGIRLGIEGVNPIYYEGIKTLFTFPQSVGIAGGRPSSSYYFVGTQGDNLFYLDPHHSRPTVALRTPPEEDIEQLPSVTQQSLGSPEKRSSSSRTPVSKPQQTNPPFHPQSPKHNPSSSSSSSHESILFKGANHHYHTNNNVEDVVDTVSHHYANAYAMTDIRTFHCEKVRKMHLSGLDPSMLLGFLCKDEADYQDFRARVMELGKKYKPIFSIQAEPPNWVDDSDDNIGLESISEPDLEREETGDDDWSTSPIYESGTSPPSTTSQPQQPHSQQHQHQQRRDERDYNSDIIIEDDDDDDNGIDEREWVEPSSSIITSASSKPSFVSTPTPTSSSGVTDRKSLNLKRPKAPPAVQHYPFPSSSSASDIHEFDEADVVRDDNNNNTKPKSRNARARDGGRTQSGGIKGIYIDSGDET